MLDALSSDKAVNIAGEGRKTMSVEVSVGDVAHPMQAPQFDKVRWQPKYPELGTHRLPAQAYYSEADYYEQEREKIWRAVWLKICREEEVATPGSYLVRDIDVCDESVLIVRTADLRIRVFHNVCPHRGSRLVWDEAGSARRFACPFHDFTFDLDGRLRGVPDRKMFFDLDMDDNCLVEVPCDIWEGFVFINFAPDVHGLSLRQYLGEAGDRIAGHPFSDALKRYTYQVEVAANWKILTDIFLETWHVRFLHSKSGAVRFTGKDNPYSHALDIKLFPRHRMLSIYGPTDYTPTPVSKIALSMGSSNFDCNWRSLATANPTLSETWGITVNNIFPNFQLDFMQDGWFTHQFWPLAVDRTLWTTDIFYAEPRNAADRFRQEYLMTARRDVLVEDGVQAEQSQSVVKSKGFRPLLLQDEEIMIRHFHKTVEDYLGI